MQSLTHPLAETAPFFAQLDEEWRKDMAEIDAWLARVQAELDAAFPDLLGLEFDFFELDERLGLGNLPDFPLDLPAIRSRDPDESRKNAHARAMGSDGEGATKSKPLCGAKTRKGTSCQAPGNGKGGRCKLHGGKSSGPKTQEGKMRSLVALRANRGAESA